MTKGSIRLGVAAMVLAGGAQAGVLMEWSRQTLATGAVTDTDRFYVQQGMARMEAANGQRATIFKDDAMFELDKATKTYMVIDQAAMSQMAGHLNQAYAQMQQRMAGMPPEQRAQMEKMMSQLGGKGAVILFAVKAIQDGGILRSANATKILGISALIPLILIGIVPILTGDMVRANFFPIVPLAHDAAGAVIDGSWNMAGITVFAGGMFLAAWSTYVFETAVCYTAEFKNPKTDTFKAIFYSGLLCLVVYTLVPFAFQGYLGLGELVKPPVLDAQGAVVEQAVYSGMLAPDIYSGMGVAAVMARMVHIGGTLGSAFVIVMLVLALVLALMTSMAGSSRTLYQASVEGWLPRYLSKLNHHGAPTSAMWTDLGFNMVLLLMSDYVFVLAAANVGYLIFSFMNLNAGWIHRMDRPRQERPWRAPTWIIAAGALLAFVNVIFMGMGADVSGEGTLRSGLIFSALILPVFLYRHYVQDKGRFPDAMLEQLDMTAGEKLSKRAGILPYLALAAGIVLLFVTHKLARY